MWFAGLLAAMSLGDVAPPEREAVVAAACAAWRADRPADAPAVHSVGMDGLCFAGDTNAANSARFVEAVAAIDPETPLVVVAHSGGGEVNAAMAMAEALVPRQTTVIVQQECLSSCANYLFLAADRRVIAPGSLLGFHGGMFAQPDSFWDTMRADFAKTMNATDLEASMTASRAYFTNGLARQTAFLESVNVDVDLFAWMQGLNDLPPATYAARCPVPDAVMIVFSDAVLAEHGIVIDQNDGPSSDADIAGDIGRMSGKACYWD